MPPIETKSAFVSARVSERTRMAFCVRAYREGKRPSEAFRELIEAYAHPSAPGKRK